MEAGNLGEWSENILSGNAISVAVTAAAAGIAPRGGNWVMRQTVSVTGGTRMARYPEVDSLSRSGTTFYWSWWAYYPTAPRFGPSDYFSIWQIGSLDAGGTVSDAHPIWALFWNPADRTLALGWSPSGRAPTEGPHAGEFGKRAYFATRPVPVGQWVFFEAMIKPAADFSGAVKIWMNGELLFDQVNVKTRFPDVGAGGWMWVHNLAYGSNLSPIPLHNYVDDVTISLGRMPYTP